MLKQAEEGSNRMQSKGILNVSIAASNVASQGPDSGQQLAQYNINGVGGAMIEEMKFEAVGNMNHTGLLNKVGSNMVLPRPRNSNRSLSPFNATVSYYNAIHTFKQKSRHASINNSNAL